MTWLDLYFGLVLPLVVLGGGYLLALHARREYRRDIEQSKQQR